MALKNFEELRDQQHYEDIRKLQDSINRHDQNLEAVWSRDKINPDEILKLEDRKGQTLAELRKKNRIHYLRTGVDILATSGEICLSFYNNIRYYITIKST